MLGITPTSGTGDLWITVAVLVLLVVLWRMRRRR